jgi:hypothetical protein
MTWRPATATLLIAALAGCGGGSSGEPDFGTVEDVAKSVPPMSECPGGESNGAELLNTDRDEPKVTDDSRLLGCAEAPSRPQVAYRVFESNADRDKALDHLRLQHGYSSYFVGDRTIVNIVADHPADKPSPLADRLKAECGCGEVRAARKPLR